MKRKKKLRKEERKAPAAKGLRGPRRGVASEPKEACRLRKMVRRRLGYQPTVIGVGF